LNSLQSQKASGRDKRHPCRSPFMQEIAGEKAGITKKKKRMVLYLTTEKVYNRIQVTKASIRPLFGLF